MKLNPKAFGLTCGILWRPNGLRAAFPYLCGEGGCTGVIGDMNHLLSRPLLTYESEYLRLGSAD